MRVRVFNSLVGVLGRMNGSGPIGDSLMAKVPPPPPPRPVGPRVVGASGVNPGGMAARSAAMPNRPVASTPPPQTAAAPSPRPGVSATPTAPSLASASAHVVGPFSEGIRNLVDSIRGSDAERKSFLTGVFQATEQILETARANVEAMRADHDAMAAHLHAALAEGRAELADEVAEFRQQIREDHQRMADNLRADLAEATQSIRDNVAALRERFQAERAVVAADLNQAAAIWREFAGRRGR